MMRSRIQVSAAAVLVVGVASCGRLVEAVPVGSDAKGEDGGADGGSSADGKACKSALDCGKGTWACVYLPTATCGDFGVCFSTANRVFCTEYVPGCSCGSSVDMECSIVPAGYVVGPEATVGACGADAGSCTTDADCASTDLCGFATANRCGAVGQCYPKRTDTGAFCDGIVLGCACDGTSVNTVCEGFPDGIASKPVAHLGACDGG